MVEEAEKRPGPAAPPDGEEKPAQKPGDVPRPTLQFRRRAWLEFQRLLDPLAPPKGSFTPSRPP